MLGQLTSNQIDQILRRQLIGRIACSMTNKLYIVPVTYAFDGKSIYAHSREGMKIKIMRKNPEVCFQVDEIDNMANWRSVIVWGRYDELKSEPQRQKAMNLLMDRIAPFQSGETSHSPEHSRPPEIVEKKKRAIVFRITIKEKTGRYEKS
jgi:nitroimidazol reductase NimA-like FMN-containing flavoprotein (pyridoxamine 5'-phosphate oxidase superfamily)